MTKTLNQIDLISLGLTDEMGEPTFNTSKTVDLIRITGQIMLFSDKDKIFMGDFCAKNLISGREYYAYWLKLPEILYPDIDFLRGKYYEKGSTNSPISFIIKASPADKFTNNKFVYIIDDLNNLDR